jgi:hypothetical protein
MMTPGSMTSAAPSKNCSTARPQPALSTSYAPSSASGGHSCSGELSSIAFAGQSACARIVEMNV